MDAVVPAVPVVRDLECGAVVSTKSLLGAFLHMIAEENAVQQLRRLEQTGGELKGTDAGFIIVDDEWPQTERIPITEVVGRFDETRFIVAPREDLEPRLAKRLNQGDTWRRQGKRKGARRK